MVISISLIIAILLCLILFLLPYKYMVYLNIFLMSVVMFEPAPSDIIFCLLLLLGLIKGLLDFRKIKHCGAVLVLFCVFILISVLGLLWSGSMSEGIKFCLISVYLIIYSFYIYLYVTEENRLYIVRAYVISGLFCSALAFIGYLGAFSDILLTYSFRVKGLFKDPNVFGPFIVPAVILLLTDMKKRQILKTNIVVHCILIIACISAVVLSFSRAAWINLAVACVVYFILNLGTFSINKNTIFGVLACIILALILFNLGGSQLKSYFNERSKMQDYDKSRFASQLGGLTLASQNPMGHGPGQFESQVTKVTSGELSAHNLYIRILAENGIVGFLVFFISIGYIMVRLLATDSVQDRGIPPDKPYLLQNSAIFAIISGILVNSLVVDTLHWRHLWFFIGIGLSACTLKFDKKSKALKGEKECLQSP